MSILDKLLILSKKELLIVSEKTNLNINNRLNRQKIIETLLKGRGAGATTRIDRDRVEEAIRRGDDINDIIFNILFTESYKKRAPFYFAGMIIDQAFRLMKDKFINDIYDVINRVMNNLRLNNLELDKWNIRNVREFMENYIREIDSMYDLHPRDKARFLDLFSQKNGQDLSNLSELDVFVGDTFNIDDLDIMMNWITSVLVNYLQFRYNIYQLYTSFQSPISNDDNFNEWFMGEQYKYTVDAKKINNADKKIQTIISGIIDNNSLNNSISTWNIDQTRRFIENLVLDNFNSNMFSQITTNLLEWGLNGEELLNLDVLAFDNFDGLVFDKQLTERGFLLSRILAALNRINNNR
jgi:hypothetical protein